MDQVPSDGPLFVTPTSVDPALDQPYVDEQRVETTTDPSTGVTVRYRYVHGGFKGTSARFALYLPSADEYRNRFFQSTYPTVADESATPATVAFAVANGAYVVSSNNAGGVPRGRVLAAYRANAAAANFSRVFAQQHYSTTERPRGYLYGASGGAYQTIGAMENTSEVWDGAVPMVFGVPNAIPSFQASMLLALRVLGDTLPQVADAMAPGGGGDPYVGLDPEQRAVLREVTRLGFPLRGWWQHAVLEGGSFTAVAGGVRALDPTYVTDFWTTPGYAGSDAAVQAARVQAFETTVADVSGTDVVLSSTPSALLVGAELTVMSGPATGRRTTIASATGNAARLVSDPGLAPGTAVRLDNSWSLALEHYSRHQVPDPDQYGWNQYRDAAGTPTHPQRALLVGPVLAASTAGSVPGGNFHGKMIMLASTMDVQAYPWSADWYTARAREALGSSFADRYRLWYLDNADHDPLGPDAARPPNAVDHVVPYAGVLQQALLDLDAWVVDGWRPPASTQYRIDATSQVQLASTAAARKGVQPVAVLSVSAGETGPSGERIEVTAGQRVTFSLRAEMPPGAGEIVKVDWDFLGAGRFPVSSILSRPAAAVDDLQETFAFDQPATYFPVARVTSQRLGDTSAAYTLVQNLAAVRVVVDPAPSS